VAFGLKYIRVFWLAAILVMAGGQLVHAWEELSCAQEHSEHANNSTTKSCPSNHDCCQPHAQSAMDLAETMKMPQASFVSAASLIRNDASLEGFRQKIEYPPRLS